MEGGGGALVLELTLGQYLGWGARLGLQRDRCACVGETELDPRKAFIVIGRWGFLSYYSVTNTEAELCENLGLIYRERYKTRPLRRSWEKVR